ncbi:MAG: Gfo/Idh/MocA family oxidoreductase [Clostridia bacterium]|nr:Gfo/Idh/MocA family oxidoreductase [Clostridia bacterium]
MKQVKIGIFGANRGGDYITALLANNADIVAICDKDEFWLNKRREQLGDSVAYYTSFDKFLEHPMDAVLLANYFNEHAPFAIRCLEKGIHVLSECTAAGTMAECVELVRAAEKSNAKYMLCENYPFMKFNREIKRVCDEGTLGKILYAEGEYNHPVSSSDAAFMRKYKPFAEHWRNYLPRTYYITHSMAPIMYATGAEPIRVSAMAVFAPFDDSMAISGSHCGDRAAIITTLNNDDSVFKVSGCAGFGAHGNSYRVCGTEGQVENLRGMDGQIMLRYNKWNIPEGLEKKDNLYMPSWNHPKEELIEKEGHGGGDFLVIEEFLNCILEDRKPDFDVYFATKMSAVAILAHRSVLARGEAFDVPDFRKEEDRVAWENDRETPFYGPNGEKPTQPCSSHPDFVPPEGPMKAYLEVIKTRE